jgi:chromate reductase
METIKIVAISGSLRSNSSNNAVLRVAAQLVPAEVAFTVYEGLGALPHFNDSIDPADTVKEFRTLLKEADGIIICSPEYAFGVPGSLKNAIDWTVSSGEFVNKPTALITAATGGNNAHAALLLTFTALSANIAEESKLLISFVRYKMNAAGEINDPATIEAIQHVVSSLLHCIEEVKGSYL